jgi:glycosyltransferase involved in cell wall biosynthesis
MPRLLHLIDTGGPGGAESVLASLAEALPPERWRSTAIIPREDWLAAKLSEAAIETEVLPSQNGWNTSYLAGVLRTIRHFTPDLIHAHLFRSSVYGTLAGVLAGNLPVMCTLHGYWDVNPSDPLLYLKGRILTRTRNQMVYVSRPLRRHMENLLGSPEAAGMVIHNGVRFTEPQGGSRIRDELGLRDDDLLVGAVGNVRPPKDYPNLLRAAALVVDVDPRVSFAVVGDGDSGLSENLIRLRRELGLDDRFHFLGFREDVPACLDAFDLFVSSSVTEGLPLASMEALGMGKPAVLTRCGGVPELVADGRTGLLVPPRQPESLARGILSLVRDPGRAAELGARARKDVRGRFSLESMVQAYVNAYESLLSTG